MPVEILHPESREEWLSLRRETIGASEAPALLGAHPFVTGYSLWALKSGALPPEEENAAMRRGRLLESVAVQALAEQRPDWELTANSIPGGAFYRSLSDRLSATPDCFARDPSRDGRGVIQVKSIAASTFRKTWRNEYGEVEPPLYAAVQAIIEAHMTGATWAAVAGLVVDYAVDVHVIDVPLHAGLIDRIKAETAKFWQRVEAKTPPPADYGKDGALIAALYAADNGEEIDLTSANDLPGLMAERESLSVARKSADERIKEINAAVLSKMGQAATARIQGGIIKAPTIYRKEFMVKASSHRRITFKETHA